MKIRNIHAWSGHDFNYAPGEVVEMPDELAHSLIASGMVEEFKQEEPQVSQFNPAMPKSLEAKQPEINTPEVGPEVQSVDTVTRVDRKAEAEKFVQPKPLIDVPIVGPEVLQSQVDGNRDPELARDQPQPIEIHHHRAQPSDGEGRNARDIARDQRSGDRRSWSIARVDTEMHRDHDQKRGIIRHEGRRDDESTAPLPDVVPDPDTGIVTSEPAIDPVMHHDAADEPHEPHEPGEDEKHRVAHQMRAELGDDAGDVDPVEPGVQPDPVVDPVIEDEPKVKHDKKPDHNDNRNHDKHPREDKKHG